MEGRRLRVMVHVMVTLGCCSLAIPSSQAYVQPRPLPLRACTPTSFLSHAVGQRRATVPNGQSPTVTSQIGLANPSRSAVEDLSVYAQSVKSQVDLSADPSRSAVGVEDMSASSQALSQWYRDAGAETILKQSHFGEMRGMMATTNIKVGEELLSYPRAVTMDMSSLTDCPCTNFVDGNYWKSCLWFVQLGLWLLSEESKGSDSAWAPYIASLPQSLSRPMDWTDGQLDMLQYQPIVKDIKQQRHEFRQIVSATRSQLVNNGQDIDRLEWAMHIALSRTFHSKGGYGDSAPQLKDQAKEGPVWRSNKVLIPTQDLINHNSHANPKYSYDSCTERFVLSSDADYAAGQQVYNNYGQVSNDILLQCYGFVELDNPADTFCLQHLLTWLEGKAYTHQRCSDTAVRLSRLQSLDLITHLKDAHLTMATVDCVAKETKQALRAFLASDRDLADIAQLRAEVASDAPINAQDFSEPLNPENEMAVFEILLELVMDTQHAMTGSLQEDTDMLTGTGEEGHSMSEAERTAVLFRREKRKVIAHARDRLEYNTEMKWLDFSP